jgi:hypothetical protein
MALDEIIPEKHKIYRNGAVFDTEKGRIVAMRPELAVKNTQITQANTGEMLAKRLNSKRERIAAGANRIAAEGGQYDGTDLDFVEALAEVQMQKALNPDDPKSTDAARFLMQESGLSDRQAQESPQQAVTDTVNALSGLLSAITAAMQAGQERDVVTVTPDPAQAADSSEGEGGV